MLIKLREKSLPFVNKLNILDVVERWQLQIKAAYVKRERCLFNKVRKKKKKHEQGKSKTNQKKQNFSKLIFLENTFFQDVKFVSVIFTALSLDIFIFVLN